MKRGLARTLGLIGIAVVVVSVSACTTAAPAQPPSQHIRVAVITDDIGDAVATALERELQLDVIVDSVPGSGYLTASPEGVADRVSEVGSDVDAVVLALGSSDIADGAPDVIRDGALRQAVIAASAIAETVVLIAPLAPESAIAADWREAMKTAAVAAGAHFLEASFPATAWEGAVLTDAVVTDLARRVSLALS